MERFRCEVLEGKIIKGPCLFEQGGMMEKNRTCPSCVHYLRDICPLNREPQGETKKRAAKKRTIKTNVSLKPEFEKSFSENVFLRLKKMDLHFDSYEREWLIRCSKEFLENETVFKKTPLPFREAKNLRKLLAEFPSGIDRSYGALRPWLDREGCDKLIGEVREKIAELSLYIEKVITPATGGKTRPMNWPVSRYLNQLAQIYEVNTGKIPARTHPGFARFVKICIQNLGMKLSEDQIERGIRRYRPLRKQLVKHLPT